MLIGILQLELQIGDALNLRDKKKILRSSKTDGITTIMSRSRKSITWIIRNTHSSALPSWNDARHMESTLSKMVEQVKQERYAELLDFEIEIVSGRD